MDTTRLVKKASALISDADNVYSTRSKMPNTLTYVDTGLMAGMRSAGLSFIATVFGESHTYYREFDSASNGSLERNAEQSLAILKSIKTDIEDGWLVTVEELVSATIFANQLDMAEHLLEQSYKGAAAVTAGCVLETHLRQLCDTHSVETTFEKNGKKVPKKASALNSDLVKAGAYSKLDEKNVTSWLGLRNEAAHGHEKEFDLPQVSLMINGISGFLSRVTLTK